MKTTYVLEVYMRSEEDGRLLMVKGKFPAEPGEEENAYAAAKKVAQQYNKKGHSFAIFKEKVETVSCVIDDTTQELLKNEKK